MSAVAVPLWVMASASVLMDISIRLLVSENHLFILKYRTAANATPRIT